jgi:hypothetical protein
VRELRTLGSVRGVLGNRYPYRDRCPRGVHLLAQVRCAVINGDLIAKLKAYKAKQAEEIPEDVTRFLECLQRAAA